MECPKCQNENPEEAIFCMKCGQRFEPSPEPSTQTLSFDEKIDKIQRYLPKGLTEKILAQRGKIEGERKQVTVMFCDMEGFTPMVEKLGPEKAYSIMDEVYEILIHKIHDYEGTVNEMTGDGIMALFGAPIALEDVPQRALRSALTIHDEIAKFNGNRKGMDPIKMRIGVHTGPVVVGTLGNDLRVEFKAVGDTVNLASRMEGLAESGTTYVTKDTYRLTEGLFNFEAIGEKSVKGKEKAIPAYKLLSAKKDVHRPRLGLERSIYSEMVGRDKELDRLELQVMKAINSEGSIVNIIGEAGIGKSRLIAELKNCDVINKVFLLEGRAISTGRNLSFYPIIDLLKQWAKIGEDDSGLAAAGKLETAIRQVAPEDLYEILPFTATLMGMRLSGRYAERVKGIEGDALKKLILKNIRDLLIKATEQSPLLIVIEDFHWADTSSVELIEYLLRLAETQRIVFINVFRPGYKETSDRIIQTIKERHPNYYVEIDLQPLGESMSETLIGNMIHIKGLKHAVVDQIVKRSDGNPFFIEEVVRSFIDHGAVVLKEGAFEVTEKIDRMIIPYTINDVLMARIDRLEEKTRDLVKIASVIGRSFFYRILKEMTKTIEDIDNRLSYLQDIQLFRERKSMDEIEYLFKHALAQEAAYDSILSAIRKELHLKVAGAIENVFKERLHEFYGMLAYHYSKGEDLDKAEEFMIRAGEEALNSSASSEALSYYKDALDLYLRKYGETADPDKIAILEKNIALALYNKGEMEDALPYFDRVLKRWGIKQPRNRVLIYIKLIFDLISLILRLYLPFKVPRKVPTQKDGEIFNLRLIKNIALTTEDLVSFFTETIDTTRRLLRYDIGKIENGYHLLFCGSAIFFGSGFLVKAGDRLIKYGEEFVEKDDNRGLFLIKFIRWTQSFYIGNWDAFIDLDEYLQDEDTNMGMFYEMTDCIWFYGYVKNEQGAFDRVVSSIEKLSKISDDYEFKIARQWQQILEIMLFSEQRKLYDARVSIENYEVSFKSGLDLNAYILLTSKVILQILLKDYAGAENSLDQIYTKFGKQPFTTPSMSIHLYTRLWLDLIYLEQSILSKNYSNISKYGSRIKKGRKKIFQKYYKFPYHRTFTLNVLGRYYWLINKQGKAVKWWKKAINEGKRLGARPGLARTYMEIGKRFLEGKSKYKEINGISAEGYLEKARTMFQEMDLQWDLDELDKISMAS